MNNQAISILAEKGLTGEKPTVDHKLSMNHHCLARKEKETTIYVYKDEICKTQKLSLPNNCGRQPEHSVRLGRMNPKGSVALLETDLRKAMIITRS